MHPVQSGAQLLLVIVANSLGLRSGIEQNGKVPPAGNPALHERLAEGAGESDRVLFKDFEANGIRVYGNPKIQRNGVGQKLGRGKHEAWHMDRELDRHAVVNFRQSLEEAATKTESKSSPESWELGFESVQEEVKVYFASMNRADQSKLLARTVLYLFQLLATIIWCGCTHTTSSQFN